MATLLQYAPLINAAASVLMLIVWGVYLDLFWRSYRRRFRAKIVIGNGEGMELDALCLVSNMGAEAIHIEGLVVVAEREGRRWAKAITSISEIEGARPPRKPVREGPLKSGDYIVLGTFRQLVELAKGPADPPGGERPLLDTIAIWAVAALSTEPELVFARRRFRVRRHEGGAVFRPEELETRRIRRANERREIEEILRGHLDEAAKVPPSRQGATEPEAEPA
jgi:hypothetical protein